MAMIRQCKLKRGPWYTVAWIPEEHAVIGNAVEIVMMHDTCRTEDERRVVEGRREWWTVVERWTLLPTLDGNAKAAHRDGHHSHDPDRRDPHGGAP